MTQRQTFQPLDRRKANLRAKAMRGVLAMVLALGGCGAGSTDAAPPHPAVVHAAPPAGDQPGAPSAKAIAVPVLHDAHYGVDARQVLDLYVPAGKRDAPLVVFVHGGRWFRGGKEQAADYGRIDAMLAAGLAVATINYRYSTTAIWPAQQDDVLSALEWLKENGTRLGIDSHHLALWGQSSGAHLALAAATVLARRKDMSLRAVVAWFPPSDLTRLRQDRIEDDVPGGNETDQEPLPESMLIGAPIATAGAVADAASPAITIAALPRDVHLAPVLLAHGTMDPTVSPLQSQRLQRIISGRPGGFAKLDEVPGARHGGPGFETETAPSIAFIQERIAP